MKNVKFLMGVLAMGALVVAGCSKKDNKQDMDNIAEDGFYVVGAATAVESVKADNAAKGLMGAGINEADKTARAGLYEKYVALEGGKEFELVLKEGTAETHYGAELKESDPYDVANGITIKVLMGELKQNLKMSVPKSGFYHIALDLNKAGDLPNASIIVAPVEWRINNDDQKILTASEFNKEKMTWTLKGVEMKKGDKYKYAYGGGWKIKVTPAAEVNIETNLGEGMKSGAADIIIANSGKYDFELVWNLTGGAIEKNFTDNTKCTEKYEEKLPDNVYMIGNYCGWAWENASDMVQVNGYDAFWTVKYLKAGEGFKFNTVKNWDEGKDFTKLMNATEGTGTDKDGNLTIAADGFYLLLVDYAADKIVVEPAQVYGVGKAFGNVWPDGGKAAGTLFTAEGETLVATTTDAAEGVVDGQDKDGGLRMFVYGACLEAHEWWKHEFVILDGKIAYRGNGGDQERVAVAAGKKIILDFNAGTGTIQ